MMSITESQKDSFGFLAFWLSGVKEEFRGL